MLRIASQCHLTTILNSRNTSPNHDNASRGRSVIPFEILLPRLKTTPFLSANFLPTRECFNLYQQLRNQRSHLHTPPSSPVYWMQSMVDIELELSHAHQHRQSSSYSSSSITNCNKRKNYFESVSMSECEQAASNIIDQPETKRARVHVELDNSSSTTSTTTSSSSIPHIPTMNSKEYK